MSITLTLADWLTLLGHFLTLSLLSIGGVISTVPDMHRVLVDDHHWLLAPQFNASIALGQAAPGPNVLFVALLGWNVGLNAAGGPPTGLLSWASAALGMLLALVGILLPSTTLTFVASRWAHQNRELRAVRAFKQGMAPIVVGLMLATSWVLTTNLGTSRQNWPLWLLAAVSALLVWRTRLHLLWLLGAGGLLGWFGLV
ncbi:MAG: chromate transporter [Comamonadaceae bacterium CG1_02_60_18]|nr:MAG: chromate transporter [Comamonadaceae bacterium CG1_02_60_18]PIQ53889.1 MAG: chromate transporter [Comamonadaceae bacterium CG12_big_fil_rev_8_21_14_0_65_59_15]